MRSLKSTISWYTKARWTLAASMLLSAVLFYVLAYRPQTTRLGAIEAGIRKTGAELAICQDETRALSGVAQDVERLKTRLKSFKTLPQQQELAQFTRDIAELGQQSNLKRFEHRQMAFVRGERLNTLPITLTFEGDFVQVFSFLRHTEELQRLTRVPAMNIKAKDGSGQVRVQMTMNLFFAAD